MFFLEHTCINNAIDKNVTTRSCTLIFVQLCLIMTQEDVCYSIIYESYDLHSFVKRFQIRSIYTSTHRMSTVRYISGCYLPRGERVGSSFISQMLRARVIQYDPDFCFETFCSASVSWEKLFLRANSRQLRVYVGCNGRALQGTRRHGGHP